MEENRPFLPQPPSNLLAITRRMWPGRSNSGSVDEEFFPNLPPQPLATVQTINTREHTPDRARVLSQNMAHFGNLCRVFERLNRMPSLEPILEKIQARLEIAQLKAERLRNNPGKAPKAPLRPEDGKERLEQLYDLVSLYAAAYWNSSQLECLDSLCDDAAGMGFRTEDIQFLIEEIKQVIRDKAGNSQSSASS